MAFFPCINGPIIVLIHTVHVFVFFFLLCRVAEGLRRMSLGIMYLGLFAVLEPWFSANILLSDEFQVCKLHVVLVHEYKTVLDCNIFSGLVLLLNILIWNSKSN